MTDPFQDVDSAGPEFIKMFADSMDERQSDPKMEEIVASYLATLRLSEHSTVIEVRAGAGAVTRRIAAHSHPSKVIGFEPSKGFVADAKVRGNGYSNLEFIVADGASLPVDDVSVDAVIMHTVLTHVENPRQLVAEAFRVLKSGGSLNRLKSYCGTELPRYMQPGRFETCEELPKTTSGKHDVKAVSTNTTGEN